MRMMAACALIGASLTGPLTAPRDMWAADSAVACAQNSARQTDAGGARGRDCRELRLLVFLDSSHPAERVLPIIEEASKFLSDQVGISLVAVNFDRLQLWLGPDESYLFYELENAARKHTGWDLAVCFSATGSQYDYGAMDYSRRYIIVHNYGWMTLAHEVLHAFYKSRYHSTEGILAAYYGKHSAYIAPRDKEEILANKWQEFPSATRMTGAGVSGPHLQSGEKP